MIDWLSTLTSIPADGLKAFGTIAVGAVLGVATYVVSRIKEARRLPEQALGLPRVALDPADRDLGFTIVRTGTDLTRALHDHADALARCFPPTADDEPPPPARRARSRRS